MQDGVKLNRDSGPPLLFYAFGYQIPGHVYCMVADLLKHGADLNEMFNNETPWTKLLSRPAADFGDEEFDTWISLCKLMIQNGADLHDPIRVFKYFGGYSNEDEDEDEGGDKMPTNLSPLHGFLTTVTEWHSDANAFGRNGIVNITALFLDKGADLYQPCSDGSTLFEVAQKLFPEVREVVRKYVEKGRARKRVCLRAPNEESSTDAGYS